MTYTKDENLENLKCIESEKPTQNIIKQNIYTLKQKSSQRNH